MDIVGEAAPARPAADALPAVQRPRSAKQRRAGGEDFAGAEYIPPRRRLKEAGDSGNWLPDFGMSVTCAQTKQELGISGFIAVSKDPANVDGHALYNKPRRMLARS